MYPVPEHVLRVLHEERFEQLRRAAGDSRVRAQARAHRSAQRRRR